MILSITIYPLPMINFFVRVFHKSYGRYFYSAANQSPGADRGNSSSRVSATSRRGKQIQCYIAFTPLMNETVQGIIMMMTDVEKITSMVSSTGIEERQGKIGQISNNS